MGLKEKVRRMLLSGSASELRDLVVAEPRTMRHLLGRLWDPDTAIRKRAAVAVGHGAAAHPELGTEVLRRLMWTLNDESAMNGANPSAWRLPRQYSVTAIRRSGPPSGIGVTMVC